MKATDITREQFEAEVPAFRSPTNEIWEMVQPLITSHWSWIDPYQHKTNSKSSQELTTRAAICHTAAHAIAQLDLVLTPNGFGVVQNQNVSPASALRTENLRKELSDRAFWAREELVDLLEENGAYNGLSMFSRPLFFNNACIAKRYGLTTKDGSPITDEQSWERVRERLFKVDYVLHRYLSMDYIHWFLVKDDGMSAYNKKDAAATLMLYLRRAALCLYREDKEDFKRAFAAFIDTCESQKANNFNNSYCFTVLQRYLQSPEIKAFRFTPRGNKKEDTAFFFG